MCIYTYIHTHTHITRLFFLSLRVAGNGYETLHLIKELGIQDKILPADITSNVRASHVETYARTAFVYTRNQMKRAVIFHTIVHSMSMSV